MAVCPLGSLGLGNVPMATCPGLGCCMPWAWLRAHGATLALGACMPWPWQEACRGRGSLPIVLPWPLNCAYNNAPWLRDACFGLCCVPIGLPWPWKHACLGRQPMGAALALPAFPWGCLGICSMPVGAALALVTYLGLGCMPFGLPWPLQHTCLGLGSIPIVTCLGLGHVSIGVALTLAPSLWGLPWQ